MTRSGTGPRLRLVAAYAVALALMSSGCDTIGTLISDLPVGEVGVVVKNGLEERVDWEYVDAGDSGMAPQGAHDVRQAVKVEFVPVPNFAVGDRTCTVNEMVAYIDGVEIDRTPPGYCTGDTWIIDGQPGEPEGSGPSATHLVPDQDDT